jgi:hypothetical protein
MELQSSKRWFGPALAASVLICIMGDVYGHFFYKRRTAEILQETIDYPQGLCGSDLDCQKRHRGLVEASSIYRLPAQPAPR